MSYHVHSSKTVEQAYSVLPRKVSKNGVGGYGMGVAPHAGYDQTPTVVGHPRDFRPVTADQLSSVSLKSLKTKDPIEFERMNDSSPWKSSSTCMQRGHTAAGERAKTNTAVQSFTGDIKPTHHSGFATDNGSKALYYNPEAPAEAYHPLRLKEMRKKNPVEFFDIIRQPTPIQNNVQTTTDNFQMLGTHKNDPNFYWTTKTAVGLM
mmetsp:Transcript_40169/g.55779  ORF Transcript_40169/g.55779 Transcript_40169/m.55779 type:complete len:206 (+) Transcript_40169:217-834(+)|eukprot:CAMPEP_0196579528 /NCGR_PEP_ID=MMETSP1081-20130531/22253_1 /TAXON_ID=36882 /ORGANISM="Pyramimonas amylifera, Strain CCMP720" /LENGTH=205 /DNA_ID=CAMNT_0041899149 /DNA_START=215 /DNA_END=832 /DNA_ORIENTATION=+